MTNHIYLFSTYTICVYSHIYSCVCAHTLLHSVAGGLKVQLFKDYANDYSET